MSVWQKANDVLGTVNRGNPAESGLCTLCRADCAGKCETFLSSMKGRKLLYPRDFGTVTAGSDNITHVGISYNSLRIQGYNYGASGVPQVCRRTLMTASFQMSILQLNLEVRSRREQEYR
jgi:hypothetical protein